jgi:hypothetical protein
MPLPMPSSRITFWEVKGRPATQTRSGTAWVGMPGDHYPRPGTDYRLAIAWGPKIKLSGTENRLVEAELRIYFEGWRILGSDHFRGDFEFYEDPAYATRASTPHLLHIDYGTTVFLPTHDDTLAYAHFRVTAQHERAWKMRYRIGIYGGVFQGTWNTLTAL